VKLRHISLAIIATALAIPGLHARSKKNPPAVAPVVEDQPIHVRHFAGTVYDSRGMTVEYATVEVHNPKTHQLLASTFADSKGYFTFDDKKYGKKIEIRILQKGFNPAQYTALLRPFGDQHLHLTISPAN
jgi:hypothetical protein